MTDENTRRQCADILKITRAEAQLMAGELTADEWRTLSAVLAALRWKILAA
jgi:hypothetical protein